MRTNREKLSEVLEKRGYKNKDLINEIEQIYNNKQLPIHGVGISFCFDDDEISDLVTDWIDGFKNISNHTKTNLAFGFQEGIYKLKEVFKK